MPVKVGKRIEPGVIPASVMQYILQCLQDICYGQVVLVAQDGRLIQVEREEKLRLAGACLPREHASMAEEDLTGLAQRIRTAVIHLDFGQLVIVVKAGNVVQIERTVKQRFTGLDGEGI